MYDLLAQQQSLEARAPASAALAELAPEAAAVLPGPAAEAAAVLLELAAEAAAVLPEPAAETVAVLQLTWGCLRCSYIRSF